jgi:hypothetical protein
MAGSWLSGRLAGKLSLPRTIARGYGVMAAAALVNIGLNLVWAPSLPWSVLPLFAYTLGMSLAMPCLTLLALDPYPELPDRVGGIDRDLIVGRITALDPEVVVLQIDVEVGQDQLLLDECPDDSGHLVAVELDNRVFDLDLRQLLQSLLRILPS